MAERANSYGDTTQAMDGAHTAYEPASFPGEGQEPRTGESHASRSEPEKPEQDKKGQQLKTSDFHLTPDKPWVAETDSGYKIYGDATYYVERLGSQTGVKLVGPDGQTLGYHNGKHLVWVNPMGTGPASEFDGLKPDGSWFQEAEISEGQPALPKGEPPSSLDSWTPLAAEAGGFKHPNRKLWFDQNTAQYTWQDADGNFGKGATPPPDRQLKKDWSPADDDDD